MKYLEPLCPLFLGASKKPSKTRSFLVKTGGPIKGFQVYIYICMYQQFFFGVKLISEFVQHVPYTLKRKTPWGWRYLDPKNLPPELQFCPRWGVSDIPHWATGFDLPQGKPRRWERWADWWPTNLGRGISSHFEWIRMRVVKIYMTKT